MNEDLRMPQTKLIVEMVVKYAKLHELVKDIEGSMVCLQQSAIPNFEKRLVLIEKKLRNKNQITLTEEQIVWLSNTLDNLGSIPGVVDAKGKTMIQTIGAELITCRLPG